MQPPQSMHLRSTSHSVTYKHLGSKQEQDQGTWTVSQVLCSDQHLTLAARSRLLQIHNWAGPTIQYVKSLEAPIGQEKIGFLTYSLTKIAHLQSYRSSSWGWVHVHEYIRQKIWNHLALFKQNWSLDIYTQWKSALSYLWKDQEKKRIT